MGDINFHLKALKLLCAEELSLAANINRLAT